MILVLCFMANLGRWTVCCSSFYLLNPLHLLFGSSVNEWPSTVCFYFMLYVIVFKVNYFLAIELFFFCIQFSLTYTHFSFRPCRCICKHDEEKDIPQVSNSETCFSVAGWAFGYVGYEVSHVRPSPLKWGGLHDPQQPASHNLTARWIMEWVLSLTTPLALA